MTNIGSKEEKKEKEQAKMRVEEMRRWYYINFCRRLRKMRQSIINDQSKKFKLTVDQKSIKVVSP